MTPTTAAKNINVWHAFGSPNGHAYNYIATTTAVVTQNETVSCPTGVSWLNPAAVAPYSGNPIITQNAAEPYQAGGVGPPMPDPTITNGTGNYCGLANSTDTHSHGDWLSYSLYCSTNGLTWPEDTTTAPYGQAFGSNFTGTLGTTAINNYLLHPAWLPKVGGNSCQVSAVNYPYCYYYSAMNSVGQSGVYLNYSATIDGTYSVYGGSSTPTAVIPVNSGVYSVLNEPSLPSVITDGTLDYVYASVGNNGGLNTTLYTAPAGVGIPTTFWSTALQNASTAD
jgi:hypothetical protein